MEEVLEFVTQFEGEMKMLRGFLTSHTSQLAAMRKREESFSEETWTQLQLVRRCTGVGACCNTRMMVLQCISIARSWERG
jgi:hypothetical protein